MQIAKSERLSATAAFKPFLAALMTLATKIKKDAERLRHVSITPASSVNARELASLRAPMLMLCAITQ